MTEEPLQTLQAKRQQKIARLRSTMQKKRAQGDVTGRLPLGFISLGGKAVEDEYTMKLLAEAVEMKERGYSIRTIRRYVTEKGLRGRSGKPVSVSGLWGVLKAS